MWGPPARDFRYNSRFFKTYVVVFDISCLFHVLTRVCFSFLVPRAERYQELNLQMIEQLQRQMDTTIRRYRDAQIRLLQSQELKIKDVEGNVPLNLFLFSLHSFCSTLIEYQV
ncbi:hypothetical protein PsorP6_007543 [Peronosclerospora sorghi]|uniref:Uncharacterized protein n=1 Tax=Peronosclerospora sorghi TaxID=230839 RepID=A0ACC0WC91_9STRA|nr:hypothetical protein PsorP6_007543 [Peronosclerospora sorghi]